MVLGVGAISVLVQKDYQRMMNLTRAMLFIGALSVIVFAAGRQRGRGFISSRLSKMERRSESDRTVHMSDHSRKKNSPPWTFEVTGELFDGGSFG